MKDSSDFAPRARAVDSTLPLLRRGYPYIRRERERARSEVLRGRLFGREAIFLGGPEATALFYDSSRFARSGVVPRPIRKTLFGEGGVHGLDGRAHAARKALFMRLMTHEALSEFAADLSTRWSERMLRWEKRPHVVLLDEANEALCEAACRFAGVAVSPRETVRLARHCAAMVDGFASLGPGWLRARRGRLAAERWAQSIIRSRRESESRQHAPGAAEIFAFAEGTSGALLPREIAAVELLNIIRPIVAVARFVAFMGLALHDHPQHRVRLREDERFLEAFVQEVRRFYPFVPLLGAQARNDFTWKSVSFQEGTLAVLDVYGTLRDPYVWAAPDSFLPERFLDREIGPFDLIPQGGGDFSGGHRCAGEWLTIEALKSILRGLVREIEFDIPPQDLSVDETRIPAQPASGLVISNVRPRNPGYATQESGDAAANGRTSAMAPGQS